MLTVRILILKMSVLVLILIFKLLLCIANRVNYIVENTQYINNNNTG